MFPDAQCGCMPSATDDDVREELLRIVSNTKMSDMYLSLARDLDVMEPKMPDEVGDFAS